MRPTSLFSHCTPSFLTNALGTLKEKNKTQNKQIPTRANKKNKTNQTSRQQLHSLSTTARNPNSHSSNKAFPDQPSTIPPYTKQQHTSQSTVRLVAQQES